MSMSVAPSSSHHTTDRPVNGSAPAVTAAPAAPRVISAPSTPYIDRCFLYQLILAPRTESHVDLRIHASRRTP